MMFLTKLAGTGPKMVMEPSVIGSKITASCAVSSVRSARLHDALMLLRDSNSL